MIEQLIARVFSTRNEAHLAHWRTSSYAEHMALDGFYNGVLDPLDDLVEDYQAAFGIIGELPEENDGDEPKDCDILSCLQDDVKWIQKNRDKISKDIPALGNIVDTLSAVYLKAIYKLENLS